MEARRHVVGLIATCDPQRLDLLAPFVAHYRRYGVDEFFISLHLDVKYPAERHDELSAQAAAALAECGVALHATYACAFDAMAIRRHHDGIQQGVGSKFDWLVSADIDEFHEFPDALGAFTRDLQRHDAQCVTGHFIDRMARQGFPAVRGDQSLWSQFPLGTDITRTVLHGWSTKVMLHRPSVKLLPGHHYPEGSVDAWAQSYAVHHFKWDATVVPRLRRRLEQDWRDRCPWWTESARALEWLDAGATAGPFAGLRVVDFEDDRQADGGGPLGANPRYFSGDFRRTE